MKLFVTGGTGFVGIHTLRRLVEGGHQVRCLVRRTSHTSELERLGCEFSLGDVTDKDSVLEGMRGCESVVHLASVYSYWEADKDLYRSVNVEGTRNVMEAALEARVRKVVHVSTLAVWGKPGQSPYNEETPVGPKRFSEYAESKYRGDQVVWELHRKRNLPVVVLYPAAILGAGDPKASGQYIKDLLKRRVPARALEDSARTWVYVKDVAEAIFRALEKEGNEGEKYLVGGHVLTMGEISHMVSEISGVPLPRMKLPDSVVAVNAVLLTKLSDLTRRPPPLGMSTDQVRSMMKEGAVFDGSKAERELGLIYTPIRDALEEEIASYRS